MGVYLHERHFNPVFYEILKYTEKEDVYNILIYGGKSSAKTFSIAQFQVIQMLKGFSTYALRKESARIQTTLQNTYNKVVEKLHLSPLIDEVKFQFRTAKAEIKLSGLDTQDKIKGIESYKYLYFDELDHFSYEEYMQGQASLRGMPGQKVFGSWNPISENHWIKKELIDKTEWVDVDHGLPSPDSYVQLSKDGHTVIIKTDYRDNYWIVGHPSGDPHYGFEDKRLIKSYEAYKIVDPHFYRVNVLGLWGIIKNDSPFFWNYNRDVHIGRTGAPRKEHTLKFSFDFNIGSTYCVIYQFIKTKLENGGGLYVYKTLKGNDTRDLCRKIKRYFKWNDRTGAVWNNSRNITITGDSTGKNRTAASGNSNNYKIILEEFKLSKRHLRISKVNDRIIHSQTLVNDALVNVPVTINRKTNEDLIYDIETAYFDETTNLKKDRKDNPQDAGDCFRYIFSESFPRGLDDVSKFGRIIAPDYIQEFTGLAA